MKQLEMRGQTLPLGRQGGTGVPLRRVSDAQLCHRSLVPRVNISINTELHNPTNNSILTL